MVVLILDICRSSIGGDHEPVSCLEIWTVKCERFNWLTLLAKSEINDL